MAGGEESGPGVWGRDEVFVEGQELGLVFE